MHWQEVALALLYVIAGGCGWFLRSMWTAVSELRRDLSELASGLPSTYARRDDVRDMFAQIMSAIGDLRNDLKDKVDKP